ncbi:hypothetical protein ACFOW4_10260 [Micromonospora sp. GCM10011542]|uniref:hypothetical protein n=1 Tax=Micromonospora sp. GCM10011542 TaxID=3317337 RepID=UPI003618D2C4
MTELDDILVSGEFAAFRETYAPEVHPAGTAAVRQTVRRRRRRTAVVTAAAVVLAVAIPVGANAALHRRPDPGPAQTATPVPSETTAAPTPTASTPTPTPSTASPTPAAPDGRITRAQLLAARLDLPRWPQGAPTTCVTDGVRLRSGPQQESVPTLLGDPRYADVDGDGGTETVALVACRMGEASAKQVVAFDRDGAGRVVTMGRVVGTREGMADVTDFAVQADGRIRVYVADIQPCCSTPEWKPQRQWRTYAWAGERFDQTGGPTTFGVDPRLTDLTLTAGDLAVGAPDAKGERTATVIVTVVNKGPVDVPRLGFGDFYTIGEPSGGDLTRCREVRSDGPDTCVLDGLPAGERKTYTFTFRYEPPDADAPPKLRVVHYDSQERWWSDLKWKDNQVELKTAG